MENLFAAMFNKTYKYESHVEDSVVSFVSSSYMEVNVIDGWNVIDVSKWRAEGRHERYLLI